MRKVIAAVLVLGLIAAGVALSVGSGDDQPPTSEVPGGTPNSGGDTPATANGEPVLEAVGDHYFQQASDCKSCHAELYAEWEGSYHGMAWTDPMVQALSKNFRMTECIDCHAPQPIHITGVDQRVAPRTHQRVDGVDCLSCHLMPDGRSVAAARDIDTSGVEGACRPVRVDTLTQSVGCAGCHNQHETVDELIASGRPESCQDCHMPEVTRSGKPGRSHVFPGAHSVEMHRTALAFDVEIVDGELITKTTNVGAGHHVPTDARHRSYNVWVTAWDDRGNPITGEDVEIAEYRLYYRQDFKESTQIAHMQTREARWTLPEGRSGKLRVRLVYALNPELLAAKDVYEVHTHELEF